MAHSWKETCESGRRSLVPKQRKRTTRPPRNSLGFAFAWAGEGGQLAAGGSGRVAGAELSADEADLGAVSRRRSQRVTAQELRTALQSCVRGGLSQSGVAAGAGALR